MRWLEITVNTSHSELEALTARLVSLGVDSLITEDEEEIRRFLEDNRKYWDYVDEEFAASIRGISRIKFYLEDSEAGRAELKRLESAMPEREFSAVSVKDEDWENNWKEYYKPINVGEGLVIVPSWLSAPEDAGDRAILRLDPGLIFGTGAHATTRMCLKALQNYSGAGKRVLDLGCGSGILVRGERFEIVTANIVADVIIGISKRARELMSDGGVFITSGIIEGRETEVAAALERAGFIIKERYYEEGWNAFLCTGE